MDRLRLAIIGCGRIVNRHIEGIVNNNIDGKLVAVCDILLDKMDKAANYYYSLLKDRECKPLVKVNRFKDYNEMLEKEDIDIVIIATESGYHAKFAIDCLNHGKHVLVEKPMALSIKDADRMINIAKLNNVKLGVCYQNRFSFPIQKLKKTIEEGQFGKLINGTARTLWNRGEEYYKEAKWRGSLKLDGGALMNQCIHNIDLLQWLMGSEIESIYAQTDTFIHNIEGEDFGAIIIRFRNGSIGVVEGSVCVYPENLEETLSIFGEKGTVVLGGSSRYKHN